jgi:hypothetical protein
MTSWANYNEKDPFGKNSTVVGGDNIAYSQARHRANQAVINGKATPEQMLLARQTDIDMQRIIAERK